MDLTKFSSDQLEQGYKFYPELPDETKSTEHITVRSSESDAAIKATDAISRKKQIAEFNATAKGKANPFSLEDTIKDDVEYSAALIVDFGSFSVNGQKIESAHELMTKFKWMRKQVVEAASKEANFFGL